MKNKIRLFDVLIVVACIASVVLFANKINIAEGRTSAKGGEREADLTIVVPYLEKEIAENIKVGAPFKDVQQSITLGTIESVDRAPLDDEDFTFNGKTLSVNKDLYEKVTIHIKAKGIPTEKGILIGETNYFVGQSNNYSAGIVMLEQIRLSKIQYSGD